MQQHTESTTTTTQPWHRRLRRLLMALPLAIGLFAAVVPAASASIDTGGPSCRTGYAYNQWGYWGFWSQCWNLSRSGLAQRAIVKCSNGRLGYGAWVRTDGATSWAGCANGTKVSSFWYQVS